MLSGIAPKTCAGTSSTRWTASLFLSVPPAETNVRKAFLNMGTANRLRRNSFLGRVRLRADFESCVYQTSPSACTFRDLKSMLTYGDQDCNYRTDSRRAYVIHLRKTGHAASPETEDPTLHAGLSKGPGAHP